MFKVVNIENLSNEASGASDKLASVIEVRNRNVSKARYMLKKDDICSLRKTIDKEHNLKKCKIDPRKIKSNVKYASEQVFDEIFQLVSHSTSSDKTKNELCTEMTNINHSNFY